MLHRFYTTFILPRSKDPDASARELVLNWLLFGIIVLNFFSCVNSLVSLLVLGKSYILPRFLFITALLVFWISLYTISRIKNKQKLAERIVVATFFLLASFVIEAWGILTPAGVLTFSLVIIMAGILLGSIYAVYTALLATLVTAILEYLRISNVIEPSLQWMSRSSTMGDVVVHGTIFSILALISWLFNRQMEISLRRAKRSEAALLRQKLLLEIRIEERTRELEAAQLEKVQQFYRFAELGHLSTALFHDLANHVMSVSLDIEGLKKQHSPDIKRIQENMNHIDEVVQRVRQHIQGKKSIESFNAVSETEEVIKILSSSSKKARVLVELHISPSAEVLQYRGDITRFRQIVTNLIMNGIESYKKEGGLSERLVTVHIEKLSDHLHISVHDHGKGIPSSLQSKIFEPFYSTKDKGIGIGLFIVKKVTEEDFKGTIAVTSTKKEGTTFTVSLPLKHNE